MLTFQNLRRRGLGPLAQLEVSTGILMRLRDAGVTSIDGLRNSLATPHNIQTLRQMTCLDEVEIEALKNQIVRFK